MVPEHRLAREASEFGRGVDGRARALAMVMAEVEAHLRTGMRISTVYWLTSPQLAVAVRTGFAPGDRAGIIDALAARDADATVNADVPWAMAGPSGADLVVRHYSHDAWNSISATIKLPAHGAVIGALAPVLVPTEPGERRSLVVGVPDPRPNGRRPADPERRMGRRHGRDPAQPGRGEDPRQGPDRAGPHPRPGRQTRLRQRPRPALRGRVRHRPETCGSPNSDAASTRPSAAPGSHRCGSTSPRTPASPPPPSRSASGCDRKAERVNQRRSTQREPDEAVDRLLADFGHDLPTAARTGKPQLREARLFQPVPAAGHRRPDRGWSPATAPVSVWRMTSDQAPVLWPLVTSPGLPPRGAQMGIDYFSRASFFADPNGWVLDPDIPVSATRTCSPSASPAWASRPRSRRSACG